VERAVLLTPEGQLIRPELFDESIKNNRIFMLEIPTALTLPEALDTVKRQMLSVALRQTGGNKTQAARLLGITRQHLQHLIKKLGIKV